MPQDSIVISGTGLFTPQESISNEELVASFNQYADLYNAQYTAEIEAGTLDALEHSSVEFIEKASGIKSRFVMNKSGVLDPDRMSPCIAERRDEEQSVQCDMAVAAARQALKNSDLAVADLDAVIVACSNMQRAYPAMAIEVQHALGVQGFAYDMNVACSSATFGLQTAYNTIVAGNADRVLMVNPEICSAHLAWKDRDCHFIFGDVCTAVIIERASMARSEHQFEMIDTRLQTRFSNNIRNNAGFLNRCDERHAQDRDKLFIQNGRKVFKEVCPMVATQITRQLAANNESAGNIKRLWLHQANINMNLHIARHVLGREASQDEIPTVLDEYANTSSAGSIIAFHKAHKDLDAGDLGVLCSFGAGYSVGSVLVRKR